MSKSSLNSTSSSCMLWKSTLYRSKPKTEWSTLFLTKLLNIENKQERYN